MDKKQSESQSDAQNEAATGLLELIAELLKVDINSPMAKLNETTISENNGGRIEL